MNFKPTLKLLCMFSLSTQLLIAPFILKAQSNNHGGLINAYVDARGNLHVTPSATSSKTDFDFFAGDWDVAARKLKARLQNSHEWITFTAHGENKAILNGLGNTEPYYAKLNGQNFEGYTLRLFDPKTRLWSIYWADSNNGKMDPPQVGSFQNNVGYFYAKDVWEGKNVIVVFKWDKTNPEKPTWSQAFSADNGKTWEWNWYHIFTRRSSEVKEPELSHNQNIKVLELRNYILKPGKRDEFINYFEKHFITPQNVLGGFVLGQFRVTGQDNRFLWFRGFNDFKSRSIYLPEFYRKSLVWQKYKQGANDLIDDNDDVHLLKPLNDTLTGINSDVFAKHKGIVVIDYYTANAGRLNELAAFYTGKFSPYLKSTGIDNSSLWVSELTPNDYLSLPVIQDKDLLVAITFYKNEAEYRAKLKLLKGNGELQNGIKPLLKNKQTMVVYPTEKSFGEVGD